MGRLAPAFGTKAKTPSGVARVVQQKLLTWLDDIGAEHDAATLGLKADLIDGMVADTLASGSRGLAGTPGAAATDPVRLRAVYERALA
jgi:hypothetical protein